MVEPMGQRGKFRRALGVQACVATALCHIQQAGLKPAQEPESTGESERNHRHGRGAEDQHGDKGVARLVPDLGNLAARIAGQDHDAGKARQIDGNPG